MHSQSNAYRPWLSTRGNNTRAWRQMQRQNKPHISPKDLRSGSSTHSNDAVEAESAEPTWSAEELLEVRARERTFDGAYWRTSVGLFGASLVILRVFGVSFFPVGLVFLALGLGFLAIGLFRRYKLLNKDAHAQGPFLVKRNGYISLGIQIAFTAIFAALLGYYIHREQNRSVRYDDNWFRWYIGLLIALLVIDILCIAYTYWQMRNNLRILTNPNTPPEVIMAGSYTKVVIVQQPTTGNGQYNPAYDQSAYNPQYYNNYNTNVARDGHGKGANDYNQQGRDLNSEYTYAPPPSSPPPAQQQPNTHRNPFE
ncbi:hypothetical protein IW150_003042 [Coemansia sp. RSA 2607]|nr:hypothetical protein IW150_003042 [Coemansia sp. RSA 2607]